MKGWEYEDFVFDKIQKLFVIQVKSSKNVCLMFRKSDSIVSPSSHNHTEKKRSKKNLKVTWNSIYTIHKSRPQVQNYTSTSPIFIYFYFKLIDCKCVRQK